MVVGRLRPRLAARRGDVPPDCTAKMNDIDPQAWLADVLARIAGHPASRIDKLLPWHWRPRSEPHSRAARHGGHGSRLYHRPRAQMLGEDEDWLHDLSIDMFPEDSCLHVYGIGDGVTAFTQYGIECLKQIIADERAAGNAPIKPME